MTKENKHGPNPALTEAQVMQAYDMWCNGLTQKEIAKGMYVHENTISNSFRRYGLKKEKASTGRQSHEGTMKNIHLKNNPKRRICQDAR